MVLAKSYINVAHDDTHLTKYSHMGSNYVLFTRSCCFFEENVQYWV